METSRKLTIFEGCDGTGKTTTAKTFAKETGARYVHFPALPSVNRGLARMYVEAMLPALLGYQDVVFDRCWLSEAPYGTAFREGQDRLGNASIRMLERLAMRCGAVVVACNPGWDAVKSSYIARKHLELLDNVDQLRQVYNLYEDMLTDLPVVHYDWASSVGPGLYDRCEHERFECHPLALATAGNWEATTILVGEAFAERKDHDAFYQFPFASFSHLGCSRWLTEQLELVEVSEADVLWVNADQDLSFIHEFITTEEHGRKVVALGDVACRELYKHKISAQQVPHPQYFKRFGGNNRYPLLDIL